MKELQHGYQQHFAGDEVSLLGGQVIDQPLPTDPDDFVVATCLMLCEKNVSLSSPTEIRSLIALMY